MILQLILTNCGSFVYQGSSNSFNKNNIKAIQENFEITTKVLEVKKKNKETNMYVIDYEVTNDSDQIFTKSKKKYFVFFVIKTKSGREIGHYQQIYDKIHPGTTIIKDTRIDLSTYQFESISASIYVE